MMISERFVGFYMLSCPEVVAIVYLRNVLLLFESDNWLTPENEQHKHRFSHELEVIG